MGLGWSFEYFFSNIYSIFETNSRLIMIGLDAAGKTTILYKLKLGEVNSTCPTIGFNVETLKYKNLNLNVWDLGGQDKIRPLWKYYYEGVDGVIFVIDTSDRERINEAHDELHKLLKEDELNNAAILVYANKQDLPNALPSAEIVSALQLNKLSHARQWYVQPTCGISGKGLTDGLDWLAKILLEKKRNKK